MGSGFQDGKLKMHKEMNIEIGSEIGSGFQDDKIKIREENRGETTC